MNPQDAISESDLPYSTVPVIYCCPDCGEETDHGERCSDCEQNRIIYDANVDDPRRV